MRHLSAESLVRMDRLAWCLELASAFGKERNLLLSKSTVPPVSFTIPEHHLGPRTKVFC